MKKKLQFKVLFILMSLIYSISYSQPKIEWQKSFGGSSMDIGRSITQTKDGGYIVAGYTDIEDGDVLGSGFHQSNVIGVSNDCWIMKLNSVGSIEWKKCFGGGGNDKAISIIQTNDGGYIFIASTSSNDGDVLGNHGFADIWVVKLDNTGKPGIAPNIEWQKCLGGSSGESASSIKQTLDGGYIILGNTLSNDGDVSGSHVKIADNEAGLSDWWVIKLDNTGFKNNAPDIEWQKCLGGSQTDVAYSIVQAADGGYAITGYTFSNDGDVIGNHLNGFGNSTEDIWVVKLDNTGKRGKAPNIEWQKCMGGSWDEDAKSIQQTVDGGFIVGGQTGSTDGDVKPLPGDFGNHGGAQLFLPDFSGDYWIVKLDNTGKLGQSPNIEWQKCLGGTWPDNAFSVGQTKDGGYFISGYTLSNDGDVTVNNGIDNGWIVKLDNTGKQGQSPKIEWQKSIGGSGYEILYTAVQTNDDGYALIGESSSKDGDATPMMGDFGNHGNSDCWVVKLDKGVSCVNASVNISTASTSICQGTLTIFTATPVNGGNNPVYQWKLNGNNAGNNSATFSTNTLNNGDQVSCVMTSNAQPCVQNNPAISNTIQMTVLANPAATISANGPTTFCQGGSVTLTSSAASSYLWSTGEKTQSITVKTSGTYTVTVSNNGQCQNSASIVVAVSPSPDINLGPDGTRLIGEVIKANEVNANADVNINPKNYLFFWNPPANTPTYTINTIGSKQYTLNTIQGGCASTSTVNIVSYCKTKGTTKDMSNNVNYIDRVTVDVLDVNNVAQNLITNISGDNGGYLDYTKKAVINLTKSKTHIITVYPYTKTASGSTVVYATAWIDYDHNGIFESMDALGLNEQVPLTYSKIGLRVAPTVSISNYKVPFGAYNGITRMRIAMKITNDLSPCDIGISGLNGLNNNFFGETEDYSVDIEGGILINGRLFSSVKEKENNTISNKVNVTVSPNPFTQKATLTLNNTPSNKKYTLVITDIYGRKVRQINNITTSTIEINRGNLTSGIYEYQVLDGTNITATGKMVIQ